MKAKQLLEVVTFIQNTAKILENAVGVLDEHEPLDVDDVLPPALRLEVAQLAAAAEARKKYIGHR